MKIIHSFLITFFIFTASQAVLPCTAFYLVDGERVIAGNSEDYFNPNTRMWFIPGSGSRYGAVYFGFDDGHSQGGMNEKGLFYDGFWVAPEEHTKADLDMDCPQKNFDSILKECATVEEALVIIKEHQLHICTNGKLFYGDATGDAVIIGNGAIIRIGGNYLISTNFFENRINTNGITCKRYLKAEEMIKNAANYTPELAKSILKNTTTEFTQYSIIYDLKNRKFTLFHFKNFEIFREYNLEEELKKGEKHYNIPDLFPDNTEFKKRYFSKITPHNNHAMEIFLSILMFLFFLIPVFFGIARILERNKHAGRKKYINIAQLVLTINSSGAFLLSIALKMIPSVFILGLPENLEGLTLFQKIAINIPGIVFVLILILLTIYLKVREKELWTPNLRSIYLFSVALFCIFEGLIYYWGFFRVYI